MENQLLTKVKLSKEIISSVCFTDKKFNFLIQIITMKPKFYLIF